MITKHIRKPEACERRRSLAQTNTASQVHRIRLARRTHAYAYASVSASEPTCLRCGWLSGLRRQSTALAAAGNRQGANTCVRMCGMRPTLAAPMFLRLADSILLHCFLRAFAVMVLIKRTMLYFYWRLLLRCVLHTFATMLLKTRLKSKQQRFSSWLASRYLEFHDTLLLTGEFAFI